MREPTNLPRGWTMAVLGELGEWAGGGTPSTAEPAFWRDGSIPWVSPKDMKSHVISDAIDRITENAVESSATKLIQEGSVLFVTRSGILSRTLPVARTAVEVTVNQDIKALTPGAGVHPDYVAWGARAFEHAILERCSKDGTTVASIDTELLHRFPLPLAPEQEQRRIVETIESYFTRVDDAVATLERVQRNLKRYRASVLKAAVEGRLVQTEAELARAEGRDYEPASALLERILMKRGEYVERPLKRGCDNLDLPELPKGWCWARLDGILAEPLANGRSVKTADTGFPVLRLTSLRNGTIDLNEYKIGDWSASEAHGFLAKEGDFFVARGNGSIRLVGVGGLVPRLSQPVAYPDTMIRIRLSAGIDPAMFAHIWNSRLVRTQIESKAKTTAGIFKVNQEDLGNCVLPIAPTTEQVRIRKEIDRHMSLIETADGGVSASLRRAITTRQSILKWAFEGRLVDQDPSDEPASELLARIRAARAAQPRARALRRSRAAPR